jgi:hypothetical protein
MGFQLMRRKYINSNFDSRVEQLASSRLYLNSAQNYDDEYRASSETECKHTTLQLHMFCVEINVQHVDLKPIVNQIHPYNGPPR